MTRLIAACIVIIAALAVAAAQPAKEKSLIEAKVDENKDWVWVLPSSGEVRLIDMLEKYSSCRNLVLIYDPKKIAGITGYQASQPTELKGEQIDLFVANVLGEYRLALVGVGGDQRKIIPAYEASTVAPVIGAEQLEATPDWHWITLLYQPVYVEGNGLRGTLQSLMSHQTGLATPIVNGGVLISDRADRVKEVYKACVEIDLGMATEIRAHDVPEGANPDEAARALTELLGSAQKYRLLLPTFTRAPGQNRVLVRGTTSLHAEVSEALKAMK